MRPKEVSKKLNLIKTTISNLNRGELREIYGGSGETCSCGPTSDITATVGVTDSCWTDCCA